VWYLLTPQSRVLLEKLTGLQILKKFPAFYGTRRFIAAFTSTRHLSPSLASSIQSILPHHTSWRSDLILFSHQRMGLPSGLFPSDFPTKTMYTPLPNPTRATCPAHIILLYLITRTIVCEEYRSFSSSLWCVLHTPVTSSLLCPNIFLNILFSNTMSLSSSPNISDQVSHPYKTTDKIIFLYIFIFKFLDRKLTNCVLVYLYLLCFALSVLCFLYCFVYIYVFVLVLSVPYWCRDCCHRATTQLQLVVVVVVVVVVVKCELLKWQWPRYHCRRHELQIIFSH
jgi:hypothetical protein